MPATPQTRAELEDLLLAYVSDPLNKQNTAAAVREVIRAVFNSSYNRADDPLNPSTPPGAASYGTITGLPEDSASLANRLAALRSLANRAPNYAPGATTHTVRFVDNTHPGYTDQSTLASLAAGLRLRLEDTVSIVDPLPGEASKWVVKYDPAGFVVWRDGENAETSTGSFYPVDSPEAASANIRVIDNVIADWGLNETGKILIGGSYAYFGTNAAGGPFAPPTTIAGNSDWHPEAEPLASNQFYQPISVATAQSIALADNAIHPIQYRILRGSDGTSRRGDVVVQGIAFSPATESTEADIPARFATLGLWLNPETEQWVQALYDIATDTVIAIDFSRLAALSNPFYSPNPASPDQLRGYTVIEDAFNATYGQDSYIVLQVRGPILLAGDAILADITIYGRKQDITVAAGQTLNIDGVLNLDNTYLYILAGGTLIGCPDELRGGGFGGAAVLAAGRQMRAYDADLSQAVITGTGTIYLFGNTRFSDAQLVAARAAGVTVLDLRPDSIRSTVQLTAAQASAYTLTLADAGNVVPVSAAATVTIPPDVFAVGTVIDLLATGAHVVTVAGGSGVTPVAHPSLHTGGVKGDRLHLFQWTANEWIIDGGTI